MDIEKFLNELRSLPDFLIYFFLGLSAFVENLVPPIPGDTITAFGAFLVGMGRLSFAGVYISTTVGSLLGFLSLFWVGGFLGRHFFIERDFRFLRAKDIIKAEEWFGRYGYFLILIQSIHAGHPFRRCPGCRNISFQNPPRGGPLFPELRGMESDLDIYGPHSWDSLGNGGKEDG